jgi:hypothetical protein
VNWGNPSSNDIIGLCVFELKEIATDFENSEMLVCDG